MTAAAEPFDCAVCGLRIGRNRTHYIIEAGPKILCTRCMENRRNHALVYPDCPVSWHDMFDHGVRFGTRVGARCWLTEQGAS